MIDVYVYLVFCVIFYFDEWVEKMEEVKMGILEFFVFLIFRINLIFRNFCKYSLGKETLFGNYYCNVYLFYLEK